MDFSDPILQFGFAGFALVLLGVQVWLIRMGFAMHKCATKVIAANTDAIAEFKRTIEVLINVSGDRFRDRDYIGPGPRRRWPQREGDDER